jgi:hypothetical protein
MSDFLEPEETATTSSSNEIRKRKCQFRFSNRDDIALVREIASISPFTAPHGKKESAWQVVTKNFNNLIEPTRPRVSTATIVRHFDHVCK